MYERLEKGINVVLLALIICMATIIWHAIDEGVDFSGALNKDEVRFKVTRPEKPAIKPFTREQKASSSQVVGAEHYAPTANKKSAQKAHKAAPSVSQLQSIQGVDDSCNDFKAKKGYYNPCDPGAAPIESPAQPEAAPTETDGSSLWV